MVSILSLLLVATVNGYARPIPTKAPTGERAHPNPGWSVAYRAIVVGKASGLANLVRYRNATDSTEGQLTFILSRSMVYFTSLSDSARITPANNIARFIRNYVIGDSSNYYKKFTLVFMCNRDSSIHKDITYRVGQIDSIWVGYTSIADRWNGFSTILPFGGEGAGDPRVPFKKRALIYRVSDDWGGHIPDKFELDEYSNALATLIFDYVLERNTKLYYWIAVEYDSPDHVYDMSHKPVETFSFSMDSKFVKGILNNELQFRYEL